MIHVPVPVDVVTVATSHYSPLWSRGSNCWSDSLSVLQSEFNPF